MKVHVVPAGWSWAMEGAVVREREWIERTSAEPDTAWLADDSPERMLIMVDASDSLHDVVTAVIRAMRPNLKRKSA